MNHRSHLVIGTGTAVLGSALVGVPPETGAVVVGAAVATANFPDWDKKLGIPHRGITHTVVVCALLALAVYLGLSAYTGTAAYAVAAAVGVATGYGMHLVADACTQTGVPALWPLYPRHLHPTGGKPRSDVHLLPGPLRITTGEVPVRLFLLLGLVAGALYYLGVI
jgi:membrane-bound metal-dependent hydrolase YbcI (DUF457 family)